MSGSDDTDCLLMIPPDFHINNAEQQLSEHQRKSKHQLKTSVLKLQKEINMLQQGKKDSSISSSINELSAHNLNLHNTHMALRDQNFQTQFILSSCSDVSSISLDPHRAKTNLLRNEVLCSTPKSEAKSHTLIPSTTSAPSCTAINMDPRTTQSAAVYPKSDHYLESENILLQEIDDFLHICEPSNATNKHNCKKSVCHCFNYLHHKESTDKPKHAKVEELQQKIKNSDFEKHTVNSTNNFDLQMFSLSDMWQHDDDPNGKPSVVTYKEEQLRRKHLQKTVHTLQARLLEYQQRLSVAIEVDRCKNEAITAVQNENSR